jgi:hypothetical protein
MLVIGDKIVSLDILKEDFACNLNACKGACCWEGDYGASLEAGEDVVLEDIKDKITPFMREEGIAHMKAHGTSQFYEEPKVLGTPILENGACIYLTYTKEGIGLCAIEQAYFAGEVAFRKPISCHLYPIRVKKDFDNGFERLDYYRWDICDPACVKGKKENIPVYEFLKGAIIRKYGDEFYEALEDAAKHL